MSVIDKVQHYQRSIEKCWDDEERMMHCISKLYQLPITVQHLRDTGVGRTVNSLRKYDGGVGDAAKALVAKWKTMVANEDSSDAEDEDEACVPDAPESYSDNPESPKRDENSENGLSRTTQESSKERHKKSSKSSSSSHGSKHSPKGNSETESKSREKHSSSSSSSGSKEKQKSAKDEEQREKSRKHTKHDSDSDSRKGAKDDSMKKDLRDSRDKRDDGKVSSSTESVITNGNDSSRKRKQERSEKESKKAKYSESESEEENSRLVINSPSESELTGIELGSSLESETKKSSVQSCDKSSRKEGHKDRKREKDEARKLRKSEEKDSQRKESKKDDKRKKESSHKHSSSKSKSSHSSSRSSSKDSARQGDINEEEKSRKEEKSRSEGKEKDRDKEKEHKVKKKIKKEKDENVVGIDSQSGTSFADALGMCMLPPPSRKKGGNVPAAVGGPTAKSSKAEPEASTSESGSKSVGFFAKFKTEDTDLESNAPSLLAPNVKLEPLSVDLAATLPEISPNYKPLTYNMNPVNRKFEEDRSLSEVIYSKNQRTKVFSGNKTGYSTVPSLYEMCIRVLIENIDALEVTGGVPFYILKPVLERATPDQLYMLEHHNPYLVEETDPLWQFHCNREFRTKKREEMESWREMYMRCLDEREAKLKALTANIKQSIDKSTPVRSTIQVNDNFHVKPPRSVLRKQAKYGTAKDLPVTSSELKRKLISGVSKPPATTNSCSPIPIPRLKATSSSIGKKTKAPLMAKALQLIKGRYRR